MFHRSRYLAWHLLAAGLLVALEVTEVRPVLAQGAPIDVAPPPTAPSNGKQVIASSRPVVAPAVPPFGVPDDGLVSPTNVKPTPSPVAASDQASSVKRALYQTESPGPPQDAAVVRVGGSSRPGSVSSQASSLSVEVVGPASVSPGEFVPYEIVVTNPGVVLLARVRIEDQLPAGAKLRSADPTPEVRGDRLVWDLGNLEGRGQRRIRVEIQPGGVAEMTFSPTATFTAALGLKSNVVQPSFLVTQSAPEVVQRGSTVAIQIQVANHGTAPLTNVVLQDQLPPGLEHSEGKAILAEVGTLTPGETKTLRLEVIAAQAGRFVNEVTARADGDRQTKAHTAIQVTEATLSVKIESPERIPITGAADIRLEAFNPGPAPAINVRLTQLVPEGFDVLSASTGGVFDPRTRTVTWSLGTLQGGQRQIVALKVKANLAGDLKWSALLTADRIAEAKAVRSIIVEGSSSLVLEVVARETELVVGSETIVDVHALNQGTAPSTKVHLTVQAAEGLFVARADGPTNGQQGQQVAVFDALPSLAVRGNAVFKLKVRGQRPGDFRVVFELTADNLTQPVRQELVVRVR